MFRVLCFLIVVLITAFLFKQVGKASAGATGQSETSKAVPDKQKAVVAPGAGTITSGGAQTSSISASSTLPQSSGMTPAVVGKTKVPARLIVETTKVSDNKVHFTLQFPKAQITDVVLNGETYQKLTFPESKSGSFDYGEGTPELPIRHFLIRISNGNKFGLDVASHFEWDWRFA